MIYFSLAAVAYEIFKIKYFTQMFTTKVWHLFRTLLYLRWICQFWIIIIGAMVSKLISLDFSRYVNSKSSMRPRISIDVFYWLSIEMGMFLWVLFFHPKYKDAMWCRYVRDINREQDISEPLIRHAFHNYNVYSRFLKQKGLLNGHYRVYSSNLHIPGLTINLVINPSNWITS